MLAFTAFFTSMFVSWKLYCWLLRCLLVNQSYSYRLSGYNTNLFQFEFLQFAHDWMFTQTLRYAIDSCTLVEVRTDALLLADKFGAAMALVKADIGGNISVCHVSE